MPNARRSGVSERRSAAILALPLEAPQTPEIDAGWLTPREGSGDGMAERHRPTSTHHVSYTGHHENG
jgi:hypothetical protein